MKREKIEKIESTDKKRYVVSLSSKNLNEIFNRIDCMIFAINNKYYSTVNFNRFTLKAIFLSIQSLQLQTEKQNNK